MRTENRHHGTAPPDLVVLLPQGKVLLVEVKTIYGRQSDAQKAYQKAVENMGHRYEIWRSVDDAEKFFKGDNVQTNGSGGGSPLTPKLPPLKAK